MSGLRATLSRMVEGMPSEGSITLPVEYVRDLLQLEDEEEDHLADLTVADVAEEFGKSENAVRDWIRAGELEAYRFRGGGEYRIPRDAVRRFVANQRGENDGPPRVSSALGGRGADLGSWRRHFNEDGEEETA